MSSVRVTFILECPICPVYAWGLCIHDYRIWCIMGNCITSKRAPTTELAVDLCTGPVHTTDLHRHIYNIEYYIYSCLCCYEIYNKLYWCHHFKCVHAQCRLWNTLPTTSCSAGSTLAFWKAHEIHYLDLRLQFLGSCHFVWF